MPPWKPVAGLPFVGERILMSAEIEAISAWVDAGCPDGDPKQGPPPRTFPKSWSLGEPDLILTPHQDFILGANGEDLFRCFALPTGLNEDRFVIAYEVRPGNTKIVHHTLNFYDATGTARRLEQQAHEREKRAGSSDHGSGYVSTMGIGFTPK